MAKFYTDLDEGGVLCKFGKITRYRDLRGIYHLILLPNKIRINLLNGSTSYGLTRIVSTVGSRLFFALFFRVPPTFP